MELDVLDLFLAVPSPQGVFTLVERAWLEQDGGLTEPRDESGASEDVVRPLLNADSQMLEAFPSERPFTSDSTQMARVILAVVGVLV